MQESMYSELQKNYDKINQYSLINEDPSFNYPRQPLTRPAVDEY